MRVSLEDFASCFGVASGNIMMEQSMYIRVIQKKQMIRLSIKAWIKAVKIFFKAALTRE